MPLSIGILSFAHLHAHSYAHAINALAETELAGIADHTPELAQRAASQYGARAYGSFEELLDSDVSAVVIASENVHHLRLTEMAARAGKHVLCEKPLATTVDDANAMIQACSEAGVKLMTAFPCRFSPAFARLRAAVSAGQIGRVLAIRGTNRGKCPFGWFVDKALSGGGAVIDHTVHVTDLMRWLLKSEVSEVCAEIGNGIYHQDWDDSGFLTLQFDNGVFATLDTSWSRPASFPVWGDVTMAVVGESGTITLDMFSQNLVSFGAEPGVAWDGWGDNVDLLMMRAFAESVIYDTPAPVTGEDGRQALAVALAAYSSAEEGKPVKP